MLKMIDFKEKISEVTKKKLKCNIKVSKVFYKRLYLLLVAISLAIGTLGCAEIKNKFTTVVSTAETKLGLNTPTLHNLGDMVQLKDYKVTVNGISTLPLDKERIKPKDGNEFILVNCTIENISNENKDVSSINLFKAVDKDGVSYSQSLFTNINGSLDGTIEVAKKVTGLYWIEVPKGKTGFQLEFDSSLTTSANEVVVLDGSPYGDNNGENNKQSNEIILNKPFYVETKNGKYTFTVEGARVSNKRKQGQRSNVSSVVYLDYSYENKSYGEKIGRDLYIDSNSFKVTDDEGKVLETYPVDDDNRIIKKVPIGGKCNGSIAYGINGNSKNINVTFIGDSKKVGPIKVPIKQ